MSGTNAQWCEIALPVAEQAADEIAAQLAMAVEAATSGIWVKEREVVFWVDQKDAAAAAEQTQAFARSIGNEDVIVRAAQPEEEWRDAWKKYFKTTRFTRQLVIVPSWDTFTPGPGDLELHLDPGQAFGTGDHASTKLILLALQNLKDQGFEPRRILDVGTGSGILTVAAAKLWPNSTGLCVDCDPLAVDCARDNLQTNGVAERFVSSATDVADIDESFDLVLANIQLDVLLLLGKTLLERTRSGGRMVLSGLLTPQTSELLEAYGTLAPVRCEWNQPDAADPQWSALLLVKP